MIGIDNQKLLVFDRFVVDLGLPKFKQTERKHNTEDSDQDQKSESVISWEDNWVSSKVTKALTNRNIFRRNWEWIFGKSLAPEPKLMSPEDTMRLVFESKEQLEKFEVKQSAFDQTIENAKLAGQIALLEKLNIDRSRRISENALVTFGFDRYIGEEALIKIAQKSDKAFNLDWIKNFIRPLPLDVLDKKIKLDKALIFDNYLVLYFDPTGTSSRMTQKEIQRIKDPILFGVIKSSRKLYFVADWIDQYCNLTFEELLKIAEQLDVKEAIENRINE